MTLVPCPTSNDTARVFYLDSETLGGATATCFASGAGNDLTGSPGNDSMIDDFGLTFFDYDGAGGQTDNFFSFTTTGETTLSSVTYIYGTFSFGSAYTNGDNTSLYLGFKTGDNIAPGWAVFELTGFVLNQPLTGTWYIKPVQGSGISHAAIYGTFDEPPPDVEPDPVVPEPTSMLLLGTGLAGVAAAARRRRRQ